MRIGHKTPKQLNFLPLAQPSDSLSVSNLIHPLPLSGKQNMNELDDMINDSIAMDLAEYKRLKKILGSYSDFKQKFLALEIKDEMPDIGLPKGSNSKPQLLNSSYVGSVGFLLTSPISFFYYNTSREEISRRRVYELKEYEPKRRQITAKYNRQKIQIWTGLKDDELDRFVLFCRFTDEYLYETNDYDLIDEVLKKLIEFKARVDSCSYTN